MSSAVTRPRLPATGTISGAAVLIPARIRACASGTEIMGALYCRVTPARGGGGCAARRPRFLASTCLRLEGDVVTAMTLPLSLRNWLAELILAALHDGDARRRLELAATSFDVPAAPHASEVQERARRAWRALRDRDLDARPASAAAALDSAAALFDGGLYFEVHELLEPHWLGAEAGDRKAFQGLIQIAVGFQHLANGNVAGARALLRDGALKVAGRRLHGLELDRFGRAVQACLRKIGDEAKGFDWSSVPRFPRP